MSQSQKNEAGTIESPDPVVELVDQPSSQPPEVSVPFIPSASCDGGLKCSVRCTP